MSRDDLTNINIAASHIAYRIEGAHVSESEPSVLVMDFFRSNQGTSPQLGALLADRFSQSLAAFSKHFKVLDRKRLQDYLVQNGTTPENLQSREGSLELARELGAYGVVTGTIYRENGLIAISLHLDGFGPPEKKDIFDRSDELTRIRATQPVLDLLFQKGPNYLRGPEDIPKEDGVFVGGVNGVGMPTCVYCPDPGYSSAARAAKIQATIILSVVVTPNGTAESIYVLKSAPLGLTAQAIKNHSEMAV